MSLVSWGKVYFPKRLGGVDVKCGFYTVTAMATDIKKESLWVRWAHGTYMKAKINIWAYKPPIYRSWYWKKINPLKDQMERWYAQHRQTLNFSGDYSITRSYPAIIGNQSRMKRLILFGENRLYPSIASSCSWQSKEGCLPRRDENCSCGA